VVSLIGDFYELEYSIHRLKNCQCALNKLYNGLGQRVSQEVSSVVTDYLPDVQPSLYKVLAATTSSNTDRYVHDVMGFHSQEDHNGNWSFTAPDHLGSVRAVYDESLNEDYFTRYAPYGDPFGSVGSNPTPFNFTGEPADSNGLVHLRARYYHPGLGNFISLDPLETANRYGYVDENPINFMDPSGLIYESPNGTTSINSINSGTSCGELFTNTFGGGNFRQQQDYTVCHLPRPVESICKQNLLSRSFLLSLLGTYGISISEGTIQQWKAREGVDDSKVNQRLCEMSYASFLIGTKLQSIVRNHLSNGGTCGNYSTSSPSLNDPTLMFRDILGEATQISGNSSAFGMDSTPGQTVSDPSKVNIPGRSLLNQKPDGGTYTA